MPFAVLLLALVLAVLTPSPILASGRFLQSEFLPVGARYLGMGGGHVALPGGASSAYYNPALLSWDERLEFVVEGSFVSDPTFETEGGRNVLSFHDRGNFSLVGIRLPNAGGFSFALLEATAYDHDIRGHLFGVPPSDSTKVPGSKTRLLSPGESGESEQIIRSYQDRVSLSTFGMAVGYKSSENTSFGLGFFVDRKKVFKSVDYLTTCTEITEVQLANKWYDAEATTNDISLHVTAGLYHRIGDKLDGAVSLSTGSDLQSVHQVDEWSTCSPAARFPIVRDKTPFVAQLGAAYYASRALRFAGDLAYQNWGSIDSSQSVTQLSAGGEWEYSDRVTVRAGVFTVFDPSDLNEGEHAEALRNIERSGNIVHADEYFLTAGAGYWLSPFLLVEGAIANSDLLSPKDGRTSVLVALRFLKPPAGEEAR
jgi:hypothetical protein